MPRSRDDLRAARGIAYGVILGALLWVLFIAAFLLILENARADQPMTDGLVWSASTSARQFWAASGHPAQCSAAFRTDDLSALRTDAGSPVAAWGNPDTCMITVDATDLYWYRRSIARGSWPDKRRTLRNLWVMVAHEEGHAEHRWKHTPGGLMDGENPYAHPPGAAYAWAATKLAEMRHTARVARSNRKDLS